MKSLVTGGAGFIGNFLVNRLLSMGHEVVVLDILKRGNKLDRETLSKVEMIQGDVRDEESVLQAAKSCDWIFHFAAVLGVDAVADNPMETMEVEVVGMQNVIKAAVLYGAQNLIYASTSGVYGKSAIEKAVDEEFAVSPSSSYAIAKRFNEIYLKSAYQEKALASISIRFFNVYGPKQDTRMVIPRFFEQAISGRPITVFGEGKQTRDFTYVDDVVDAVIRVAEKVEGCEIINVSNSSEISIAELAEMIKKVTKSDSPIEFLVPPQERYDYEVERRFGSSEKLDRLTGSAPSMTLVEGLKHTFAYIQKVHNLG